jgi:hypothetical protein
MSPVVPLLLLVSPYIVSTVDVSSCEVQFSGHANWIWYSQDPLLALQNPRLGNTLVGKSVTSGVNCQAPSEVIVAVVKTVRFANCSNAGRKLLALVPGNYQITRPTSIDAKRGGASPCSMHTSRRTRMGSALTSLWWVSIDAAWDSSPGTCNRTPQRLIASCICCQDEGDHP